MNKVAVREVAKQGSYVGFELERSRGKGIPVTTLDAGKDIGDSAVVVVLCHSEKQRDEWLKCINDQIRDLKDVVRRLENPMNSS